MKYFCTQLLNKLFYCPKNTKHLLFLGIIFSSTFLSSPFIKAQTLYSILVADGSEHKHNGHYFNIQRLQLETDTIANYASLEKKEFIIDETLLTRNSIDSIIALINPTKQDVIFFYFSGNEYLLRATNTDKQVLKVKENYIEFEQLQKLLKAKNARFTLLIVDLCNSISTDRIVNLKVLPAKQEKYATLFKETQGEVFAINHFPHEQHELITTADGTIFTNGFIHALHEDRKDNRWEAIMSRAKYLTIGESRGKQNPQLQISIKNKDLEPQNFNAPNNSTTGEVRMRPDDNNGNFIAPINTKAVSESSTKTVRGGNFDKKPDNFAPELTSDKKAALSQQALVTVSNFQDKIAQIALGSSSNESGKGEADLIESAMLLFSDNTKEIGISSVKRGVARKKVKKYFRKLYGIGNAYKITINWYKTTEIEDLQPQTNGTYTTLATVYQEFRKTNKNGKLVYGDRVTKKVALTLKPDSNESSGWKVLIDDIQVVAGSTEEIAE
jgi:hypothetical protein